MGRKITYDYVKQDFEKKNYTLVSEEYVGIKSKLDYVCNKHKELGIQSVTYENFKSSKDNCKQCKFDKNVILRKRQNHPKQIDIKYDKYFKEYKDKIFNKVGNEYTLNEVIGENNITKLALTHNLCGNKYIVRPYNFLVKNCRCQNKECKQQRNYHNKKLKRIEDVRKEIYDIVGDEYSIQGQYNGSIHKIDFVHNMCGHNFKMSINNFISNRHRCPLCSHLKQLEKIAKTQIQFENDVKEIHNDEYEVLGEYVNVNTPILMKHKTCGHIWSPRPSSFLYGRTRCPMCASTSKGEEKIITLLEEFNIEYISQKTFEGLVGVNNGLLSYDFYLPKYNLLIEFQGRQHEKPIEYFGGEERFKIQQEHDKRKREYAKQNNIRLIEIPYWEFDNIKEILSKELGLVA